MNFFKLALAILVFFVSGCAIAQNNPATSNVLALIEEAATAYDSGNLLIACSKGHKVLEIIQADKKAPKAIIERQKNLTARYCGKDCYRYNQAKQVCSPSSSFAECMGRWGVGHSLMRQMCAPFDSADGW